MIKAILNCFLFRDIIKEWGCFAIKFIWENWTLIYADEHGGYRQKDGNKKQQARGREKICLRI
ncbi:MAG: hypothetical protein AABY49_00730 [Planctomycetota bacterium]